MAQYKLCHPEPRWGEGSKVFRFFAGAQNDNVTTESYNVIMAQA
jgi:hypothetical protein